MLIASAIMFTSAPAVSTAAPVTSTVQSARVADLAQSAALSGYTCYNWSKTKSIYREAPGGGDWEFSAHIFRTRCDTNYQYDTTFYQDIAGIQYQWREVSPSGCPIGFGGYQGITMMWGPFANWNPANQYWKCQGGVNSGFKTVTPPRLPWRVWGHGSDPCANVGVTLHLNARGDEHWQISDVCI